MSALAKPATQNLTQSPQRAKTESLETQKTFWNTEAGNSRKESLTLIANGS